MTTPIPQPESATLPKAELRDIIDLSLWAGQLLLQHGADSARVEETVHHLGTGLGCDWLDVLVSPSAIVATTTSGVEFRTKTRRVVRFGGVNLSVVDAVNRLSREAQHGRLSRAAVRAELERIDAQPRHYPRWLTALLVGLSCAAFSRLFGGGVAIFLVTWLSASLALLVRQALHQHHFNPLLNVLTTAFVAGLVASFGIQLGWGAQSLIPLAASVLLLVPGVPLINAVEDLLNGHMVTGIARGVTGALISLSIAGGLGIAISLAGISNPRPVFGAIPSVWVDALWAAVAALGFAVLFNVPRHMLVWTAVCGAVGHALRFLLVQMGGSLEIATLVGATAVGFLGHLLARRLYAPAAIFTVSGVIPMVPGTFAFGTMLGVLQLAAVLPLPPATTLADLLATTSVEAIKTGLILGALALGIALPTFLFGRRRPVV